MSESTMKIIDLHKDIGRKQIIRNLNFEIRPGEVFGFIGPNGAGKTTTIRMMVGLIGITKGDVVIKGHSIKKEYRKAISEVGAIVENPEMYPFMTGWQNLKHFARMSNGITDERIREVIQLVGLDNAIGTKVGKYSLGMRQRLGIAQALLHSPSVLILDEPTNGLDPAGIREIRRYIRRLAVEENVSVIVSSHLLSEIELMCDRIGIIKNGKLIATNDLNEESDTDTSIVNLDVNPKEEAIEVLRTMPDIEVLETADRLQIRLKRDDIPQLVTTLVHRDIEVYGVNVMQTTLEDRFLEMIGENVID
ncbi:ABC transporter ATP-binding protein [Salinicoccus roseus]|uniref:ABC transporter ATP-binding protein n=1 Tax=Salinicoccus roseus TaxID=45670 RepID=UPI000F4DA426|nr:ABC transporter ATP-binding protein [Salinicoccus roseus]MBY8908662.1 ABC transporter ATP-binding protein [Salinicoccus roseus]RPE54235.1 ABC-2 type transport system ATP-binding protein [Salinicoccus roseus]GGA67112.1 bacitracin ABC transporter ATP-binding protein [Salinicoccus roseus]